MTDTHQKDLTPGTVVIGPFYSDKRGGVGIVRAQGRLLWTRVGEGYTPVEVIIGDRINGGYRPESLTVVERLREVKR